MTKYYIIFIIILLILSLVVYKKYTLSKQQFEIQQTVAKQEIKNAQVNEKISISLSKQMQAIENKKSQINTNNHISSDEFMLDYNAIVQMQDRDSSQ